MREGERERRKRRQQTTIRDGGREDCCHSRVPYRTSRLYLSHMLVQVTDALHGRGYDNNMLSVQPHHSIVHSSGCRVCLYWAAPTQKRLASGVVPPDEPVPMCAAGPGHPRRGKCRGAKVRARRRESTPVFASSAGLPPAFSSAWGVLAAGFSEDPEQALAGCAPNQSLPQVEPRVRA